MGRAPEKSKWDWLHSHEQLSFLVLSALWIGILYWKALLNPFSSYDDQTIIVNNPQLGTLHGVWFYLVHNISFVGDLRGSGESYYRPLFWMTLVLDRVIWGSHAGGFHLTNLLLHWINGTLLFILLRRLRVRLEASACAALLWLALPINSEVVGWISARAYCLAAFFVLAGSLIALRYFETRRIVLMPLYALAAFCALLCHESGILLIPLTILIAYARKEPMRKPAMALYAAAAGVALCYLELKHLIGSSSYDQTGAVTSFGAFYFKYLGWMALPIHMSIERSTNTPQPGLSLPAILAWAGVLGIVGAAALLRRKYPLAAVGLAWMSISLAPFCGLVPIYQGMAERFLYFASAGLALAIVAAVFSTPKKGRPVAFALVGLWVLWGGWRLERRLIDWSDPILLYQSSLNGSPKSTKLLYNLGAVSENRGDLVRAGQSYQSVLHLQPENEPAIAGLGNVNLRLNHLQEASTFYREALAVDPNDAGAVTNYAATLAKLGDIENAEAQYRRAIALAPTKDAAYCDLGILMVQQGNLLGATLEFMKAQRVDPNDSIPNFDLGAVYQKLGKLDVAARYYQKALELKPGDPDTVTALKRLQTKQ